MIYNENSFKIMSVLSSHVQGSKSTKAYIMDKRVCAVSLTHSFSCNNHFVHFDISIGGMDKRQKILWGIQ